MVKIKVKKKLIVSIFIVAVIYIVLGMLGNRVFANTPGTLTSDINGIDDSKYPGYKGNEQHAFLQTNIKRHN